MVLAYYSVRITCLLPPPPAGQAEGWKISAKPSFERKYINSFGSKALVNKSASWSAEAIGSSFIIPFETCSLTTWQSMSKRLVLS